MKSKYIIILFFLLPLGLLSCKKVLDLEPTDKIQAEDLFADPAGVKLYMANLYFQLPTEDFTFFRQGFNQNSGDPNNGGFAPAMVTDEAIHTEFGDFIGNDDFQWWDQAYKLIRDVNLLIDVVPSLDIIESEKKLLVGESAFLRAYTYFALVKRYGGVPLIKATQPFGSAESLKVPRSTEKEVWDFVLAECDAAIENLGTEKGRRANKWSAYALKSRVALHAASIAKFGPLAPMSGIAVTNKLVGLESSDASTYYTACIQASEALITSGSHGLYKPIPANAAEAAENYRKMFENPNIAPEEAIFIKGYVLPGNNLGHNYDIWFQPAQVANGWPHPGRMNPTLDLVDQYESYDAPGVSAPIITTTDGLVGDYIGYNPSKSYIRYNTPNDIFKSKDARLWGTVVLPSTLWKNVPIIIQAGYVKPDGEAVIRTKAQIEVNGKTYHTYGAENVTQYSGFDTYGGNNTRTGFSFKKFMNQNQPVVPGWNQSITDFMDMRYAEVLLNYAEAVVESGTGDVSKATNALNDIRKRAGHTVTIPLTVQNVQRERRVELAFENKRLWDLMRRREYHTAFNNRVMHSLLPLQDLRALPETKYIFVRVDAPNSNTRTFETRSYYRYIPGVGANGAIQNPQY